MDTFDLHTPFCHHIGRYRGINSAGEQTHRSAAYTGRQTTCTGFSRAVDICRQIPHLNIDRIRRTADIHPTVGMGFSNSAANLLRYLNRCHRKGLIRPFGFYLKGCGCIQIVAQILFYRVINTIQIFLTGTATAQADQTEN